MLRTILALLVLSPLPIFANSILELVPGKSLGEVSIGETSASLRAKGFTADTSRVSEDYTYLVKPPLLVLLKDDKVAQICIPEVKKHFSVLRYKGKKFPKAKNLKSISKFLGGCADTQTGTGGLKKFCADGHVELTTNFPSNDLGSLCCQ
jgi:hypothetical protein